MITKLMLNDTVRYTIRYKAAFSFWENVRLYIDFIILIHFHILK